MRTDNASRPYHISDSSPDRVSPIRSRRISDELEAALDELGLNGQTVEIHASMRSFSPRIDATDLLSSFAASDTTVLLPAFSHVFEVRPTLAEQMATNGYTYGEPTACGTAPAYQQNHLHVNGDMGALPRVAVQCGALRGNHPFNGFCALGPAAAATIASQTPDNTYGPIASAIDQQGKLLLIGVDLKRATCLHHAENLGGRQLFTRWYCDGAAMRPARTGGCSAAFDDFTPFVTPPQQRIVSGSTWSVYDLSTLANEVQTAVRTNAYLGLCRSDSCRKCLSTKARIAQTRS